MTAPPEKKESTTISMVVEDWADGQTTQFSSVHRINGYPFRMRIYRPMGSGKFSLYKWIRMFGVPSCTVSLICDKSRESPLWKCTVRGTRSRADSIVSFTTTVCSWSEEKMIFLGEFRGGDSLKVTIDCVEDGEGWRLRPSVEPFDGMLVIGEDKRKIGVNKQSLASVSPYFDRLFFGDFMEKNMEEIPIWDVEYEEFDNIIKLVYGCSEASLTRKNVLRVLELADRFDLKIVEDSVISYLLSTSSFFSLAQNLLLSEEKNIPLLKNLCLEISDASQLMSVKRTPEFAHFSDELKAAIVDRVPSRLQPMFNS